MACAGVAVTKDDMCGVRSVILRTRDFGVAEEQFISRYSIETSLSIRLDG